MCYSDPSSDSTLTCFVNSSVAFSVGIFAKSSMYGMGRCYLSYFAKNKFHIFDFSLKRQRGLVENVFPKV